MTKEGSPPVGFRSNNESTREAEELAAGLEKARAALLEGDASAIAYLLKEDKGALAVVSVRNGLGSGDNAD
jgi:hypothetical protein